MGPSLFLSQILSTVAFLPIFFLGDQEGRLFRPLAYTKTFGMLVGGVLTITVAPFLMPLLVRGRIRPEGRNPVTRLLIWLYRPAARLALRRRYLMVVLAVMAVLATVPVYRSLGSEFMPPLWEETSMYMPSALPGASIQTMREAIREQDRVLMTFPEVASVFAKAGRAETATDPAPLEMVETIVNLKPPEEWRPGMTHERLIAEMDRALKGKQVGFTNMWTMPIRVRIDMLATGIRTPIGVKVFGPDLKEVSRIGKEIEMHVGMVPGTRSAFAERVSEGYYLDFVPKRDVIARYSLTVADVQEVIQSAVGGANVTTTVEGRERYPVNVRYGRAFRRISGGSGGFSSRPRSAPRCPWRSWPTSRSSPARGWSRARPRSSWAMCSSTWPAGTPAATSGTLRRWSPRTSRSRPGITWNGAGRTRGWSGRTGGSCTSSR